MQWISVKDRMPVLGEQVLVSDEKFGILLATYKKCEDELYFDEVGTGCGCCCESLKKITHWMSIPEPPERKGE